jgi:hypothetical protein
MSMQMQAIHPCQYCRAEISSAETNFADVSEPKGDHHAEAAHSLGQLFQGTEQEFKAILTLSLAVAT